METHKVILDFVDEQNLAQQTEQFIGSFEECLNFVQQFRAYANNEIGLRIQEITGV